MKIFKLTLTIVLAASLCSCAAFKKKKQYAGSDTNSGDYVSGTPVGGDAGGTPLPERQEGVSFNGANVDRQKFPAVHFAFDSFDVSPNDSGKLDRIASWSQAHSKTIIIAGFCDERGTPEYNRVLGEKRAESVRQYLIGHGASAANLQTVSFGAEMPVNPGHNNAAWAQNRRAEFGVVR